MNPLVVMGLGLAVFICGGLLLWVIITETRAPPAISDDELDRIFPPKGPHHEP